MYFARNTWIRLSDALVVLLAVVLLGGLVAEQTALRDDFGPLLQTLNLAVCSIFFVDHLCRFFASSEKLRFYPGHIFDLAVMGPFIAVLYGWESRLGEILIRDVAVIAMLASRTGQTSRLLSVVSRRPGRFMALSFMLVIFTGVPFLMQPEATVSGEKMPFLDAVFTATSASCVTGLVVRDTGTYLSQFGQTVVLLLIQVGGLGIMVFSVVLAMLMRRPMGIQQQALVQDVLDRDDLSGMRSQVRFIFGMTFLLEFIGAMVLMVSWDDIFADRWQLMYTAVFHSISAFCNAGFSTFDDSLVRFQGHLPTVLTVAALITAGGIGFVVIKDVVETMFRPGVGLVDGLRRLRVQTKLVLLASLFLVVLGTLALYALEGERTWSSASTSRRLTMAFFQSVTARTAGFNTCDISILSPASAFVVVILMFIGASPGSAGGGVKTSTVMVLWAMVNSGLRHKEHVELFRRRVRMETIRKAVNVVGVSLLTVSVFLLALLWTEQRAFVDLLFETVSAFGTVGLTRGVTGGLTSAGKVLVILLMLIGRIGPLSMAYAFSVRYRREKYSYPDERIMIG